MVSLGLDAIVIHNTVNAAYYENSVIMNQPKGPKKYIPIVFVLTSPNMKSLYNIKDF